MNDKAIELIKIAMLHEDEGADYYTLQSEQWHEAQVVENFKQLAAEERLHSQWIQELFDQRKGFGDSKVLSFMKHMESPKLYDWSDVKKISDLNAKDVFKKAMDMELKSYDFYQSIRVQSDDPVLNQLLDILIQWEMTHYESFKDIYDSL